MDDKDKKIAALTAELGELRAKWTDLELERRLRKLCPPGLIPEAVSSAVRVDAAPFRFALDPDDAEGVEVIDRKTGKYFKQDGRAVLLEDAFAMLPELAPFVLRRDENGVPLAAPSSASKSGPATAPKRTPAAAAPNDAPRDPYANNPAIDAHDRAVRKVGGLVPEPLRRHPLAVRPPAPPTPIDKIKLAATE